MRQFTATGTLEPNEGRAPAAPRDCRLPRPPATPWDAIRQRRLFAVLLDWESNWQKEADSDDNTRMAGPS